MLNQEFLIKLGDLIEVYNNSQFLNGPGAVNVDKELHDIMNKLQEYIKHYS